MTDLRQLIEAALDQIIDPCSAGIGKPAGLVTMGLIKAIDLEDNGKSVNVRLQLRITSPCCMMGPSFTAQAKDKLLCLPGVASVDVSISPEIDWTPGHMAPSYRAGLEGPRIGYPDAQQRLT